MTEGMRVCPRCGGAGEVTPVSVGERIQAVRLERRMTTIELADIVKRRYKFSSKSLNNIESGHCGVSSVVLEAIANALGVRAGWLMDGHGDAEKPR